MTYNFSYKRYRKNNFVKKGFGWFFVASVGVIAVLLIINFADIFSSMISHNSSIFSGGKIRVSNTTMYAVCMGKYQDFDTAKVVATSVTDQGGAGYIYHSGDYFVFASIYDSIIDANSVIDKLKQDKVTASIVNINIPTINISYKGKYNQEIISCIEFFKQCYFDLYNLSIEYDSGQLTTSQTKEKIATILADNKQVLNTIQNIIDHEKLAHLVTLQNKLITTSLILEDLYQFMPNGLQLNSAIKYTYCKVVFCNIEYAKQV